LELQYIPVNRIRPNPHQPREDFPKEALEELASSIKEHGLVQPIVVRREKDGYMIVAGERRWRAYQLAKIDKVPAVVKDVDEKEVLLESLLENINRENLKWSEQENAIWDLWESGAFRDYEELGRKLGKKVKDQAGFVERQIAAKQIREKYKVPESVSTQILTEVARIPDEQTRRLVIQRVVSEKLGVHDMRDFIQTISKAPESLKKAVIEKRIDIEDARPLVEHGIPEEMVDETVQELETRKKEFDEIRQIERETDLEVVSGRLKAKGITRERDRDERIFRQFDEIAGIVKLWRPFHLDRIKTDRYRNLAVKRIEEIAEAASDLAATLRKLKK